MIAVTLPVDLRGAATTRRLVAATLGNAGWPRDLIDRAVLVGNELVANALLHGIGQPRLRMVARPDRIRLAVYDGSARQPRMHLRPGTPSRQPRGRG